jgi:hypothetical protein
MRQERKEILKKNEKFEDGVLRVDACFGRHSLARRYQEQFWYEDPSLSFGRSAVWEEKHLLNKVAELFSKGLRPHKDQSLEDFVAEYSDELKEVI